ncbi:unnamed protein product, partial [Gongylonema pulchrum]|uniref:SANT domain-containing protein n=1 Tax=Gongylonema pulchrum TaxID=637853 RepID=A0A183DGY1_9BILA
MHQILEGHYLCEAINVAGRATTECYLHFQEHWDETLRRKKRSLRVERISSTQERTTRETRTGPQKTQAATSVHEYKYTAQEREQIEGIKTEREWLFTRKEAVDEEILNEAKAYEEVTKDVDITMKPATALMELSVVEIVLETGKHHISKRPFQEIDVVASVEARESSDRAEAVLALRVLDTA